MLKIQDVTDPANAVDIYDGRLGTMGPQAMGTVAPNAERTFLFTVEFPDGGTPANATTGDNRYKNAQTQVDYNWEMVSA